MDITLAETAEGYANNGWPVFPVGADKRPLTAHGFKDATTNRDIIRYWWGERHPGAGIGMAVPETVLVLDFDPRNGAPDPAALHMPLTATVRTPSGGEHLYFRVPEGSGPFVGQFPGVAGVDVKAPGKGYVIMPPTPGYAWDVGGALTPLPDDLLETLTKAAPTFRQSETGPRSYLPWETGTGPGLNYLAKTLETMRGAREGTRNNTLFRLTLAVLSIIEQGDLAEDAAMPQLRDAALATGLEPEEVRMAMLSAYERRGAE